MYTVNSSDIINGNVREKIEALYSLCKMIGHNNKWGVYSNKHLISLPDSFIIEYMSSLKEFNIVSFNGLRYQGYITNEGEKWFYYKR